MGYIESIDRRAGGPHLLTAADTCDTMKNNGMQPRISLPGKEAGEEISKKAAEKAAEKSSRRTDYEDHPDHKR